MKRRPVVNSPEAPPVVITKAQVDAKAKAEALHPTMSELRSLPGFRESDDGKWSAPANGAWGEAMRPFWKADAARHQSNLGNGAYEPRKRPKGRTLMIAAGGVLWKLVNDEWVRA